MTQHLRPLRPSPFAESLNITQFDLGNGRARGEIDVDPLPHNGRGAAHGGVLATLLDVTLAAALKLASPEARVLGTVNLDIHYLRPGHGRLVAEGVALRVGGSIGVARAEVIDQEGAVVAVATGSFRVQQPSRGRHEP